MLFTILQKDPWEDYCCGKLCTHCTYLFAHSSLCVYVGFLFGIEWGACVHVFKEKVFLHREVRHHRYEDLARHRYSHTTKFIDFSFSWINFHLGVKDEVEGIQYFPHKSYISSLQKLNKPILSAFNTMPHTIWSFQFPEAGTTPLSPCCWVHKHILGFCWEWKPSICITH